MVLFIKLRYSGKFSPVHSPRITGISTDYWQFCFLFICTTIQWSSIYSQTFHSNTFKNTMQDPPQKKEKWCINSSNDAPQSSHMTHCCLYVQSTCHIFLSCYYFVVCRTLLCEERQLIVRVPNGHFGCPTKKKADAWKDSLWDKQNYVSIKTSVLVHTSSIS